MVENAKLLVKAGKNRLKPVFATGPAFSRKSRLLPNPGQTNQDGSFDKVLLFDLKMTYKLLYPSSLYLSLPTLTSPMLQIVIVNVHSIYVYVRDYVNLVLFNDTITFSSVKSK